MRLFVFAIGGTGSRVLTSLIMQLAAGVRPKDNDGNPIMSLSIVPIIIDPHENNDGLTTVIQLLNDYRNIRQSIYGDNPDGNGYFGVKIETLTEVQPEAGVANDQFFFRMNRVSDSSFDEFIGLSNMDHINKLFAKMLFSDDELGTQMSEGFYGSPNIGCVALNEFRKSEEFAAFRSAFRPGDRIFFVGSIFGGTGAAGLPLFISSIRDLGNQKNDNNDQGRRDCAQASIGALIVMPYFSIAPKDDSPINSNDFTIKTRSALRYYTTNLNQYINRIYYIADPEGTQDFANDPGNINNQKENKAHIVEFAGALAVLDFMSENSNNLLIGRDSARRVISVDATQSKGKEYNLHTRNPYIHFDGLAAQTNQLVMQPLMSFYILRIFMQQNNLEDLLQKPFAKQHTPRIERGIYTNRDIKDFFAKFDLWIEQIKDHGTTAHNLNTFSIVEKDNFTGAFHNRPQTKPGVLGGRTDVKKKDILKKLDNAADEIGDKDSMEARWYSVAWSAIDKLINEKYDMSNLI